MRPRDYWWVTPVAFGVWAFSILFATITFGVWAGVAAWIVLPFLFVAVLYALAGIEAEHRARRDTIRRHPSTWGQRGDRWWEAW
jgi:hypothetical protein